MQFVFVSCLNPPPVSSRVDCGLFALRGVRQDRLKLAASQSFGMPNSGANMWRGDFATVAKSLTHAKKNRDGAFPPHRFAAQSVITIE